MTNHTVINSTADQFADTKATRVSNGGSKVTAVNNNSPLDIDLTGQLVLDKYQVDQRLDIVSGEADLYLCTSQEDHQEYILKLYRRENAVKDELLAQLTHIKSHYVGSVLDYGRYQSLPFVILHYYRRGSLSGKTYSLEELKNFIIPSLNEGLKVLHEANIIHKDIKPSNLMFSDDGKYISIIDFGISSIIDDQQAMLMTKTGMSPVYSAPETFNNVFVSESDYYSLGITLYELFTGHTPYEDLATHELAAMASVQKIPFAKDFPESLKNLILGLTYKDLSNRLDTTNPNRRWTYLQVKDWLDGKNIPLPGQGGAGFVETYEFMGEKLSSVDKIVRSFALNWEKGKVNVGRGLLGKFFIDNSQEEYANIVLDCEQDGVSDFAYAKMLHNLSTDKNDFYWQGKIYAEMHSLGLDILSAEKSGEEVFFNEQFWQSISYFFADDPDMSEVLGRLDKKRKVIKSKNNRFIMLDLAYILCAGFLFDGNIFAEFSSFKFFLESIKTNSHFDYFVLIAKSLDVIKEYSFITGSEEREFFESLLGTDITSLNLDYSKVVYEALPKDSFQHFGIVIVEAGSSQIKNIADSSLPFEQIKIIYFKTYPPEKFFVTPQMPRGPKNLNQVRIFFNFLVFSAAGLFEGCSDLKAAPEFDTSRIQDMSAMFKGCSNLEKIPQYNTACVTNMSQMFSGCASLTVIPQFNTTNVTNMREMFKDCSMLQDVPLLRTSKVTDMALMFSGCSLLVSLPDFATSVAEDLSYMFAHCGSLLYAPQLETSSAVDTKYMFLDCSSIRNIPKMNLSNVKFMQGMFKNCSMLTALSDFETPKVQDVSELFFNCTRLVQAPMIDTSSATTLASMFNSCQSLKKVARYDLSKATDLTGMFSGCSSLVSVPHMDTSSARNMGALFMHCSSLLYAPNLNTGNVEDMNRMFFGCTSLKKVPHYDTSKVTDMTKMFADCKSLRRIPKFATASLLDSAGMYEGSALPNGIFRYESTVNVILWGFFLLLVIVMLIMLGLIYL